MRIAVLSILAACSFHRGQVPGVPGDVAGEITGDVATDGPPDGSPDVDTDGDGVFDAVDNCPRVVNADQRDWDGDHHGDACDHCPHLADAADPDSDGDGVGDACDPRPSTAGDARLVWLGFYDAADVMGWYDGGTGGTGAWAVTGGQLVQSTANPSPFTSFVMPTTYQHVYVASSFVVGALTAQATIGMCNGWDGTHFDCCNVNTANMAPTSVGEAQTDLSQKSDTVLGTALAGGQVIDVVENMATTNACKFGAGATVSTTPAGIVGHVLFYTGHASASFRYLFVASIGT